MRLTRRAGISVIATRLPVASVQHHPLPADHGVRSIPRMCSLVTVQHPALYALRVMTTHLAYYSHRQRIAQALALRDLQAQACALADAPALADEYGSPFQGKLHTGQAILCGDFNFEPSAPEYAAIQQISSPLAQYGKVLTAINSQESHWRAK